jgi:hypothetical protein
MKRKGREAARNALRIIIISIRALVAVSLYWFPSLNIGKISPKLTKTAP